VTGHAPRNSSTADDATLALTLARGAGQVLLDLRAGVDRAGGGEDAAGLRAAGDAGAQAWLAAALATARPDDAVLSEEAADDPRRLAAERAWIIDPLDGTREFAERTDDGAWRDDFAVHVALWQRGRGLTVGAVALPARGLVLDSSHPVEPSEEAVRAVLDGRRPLRVAVSRTRPPEIAAWLAARNDVELVPMGSVGVKIATVLLGTTDAYLHAGGQHEWDSAAPVAVARASGFPATRLDGSVLVYNQPDPWSPDLLVCQPGLAERLRALLADAGVATAAGAAR
jgi:3'(2'), 5'-bisphosphate nucleotidase